MPTSHPHVGARTFSQVLNDLGQGVGPRLTLHEVVDSLGERGFGALILVLSLVALVPWPPGGKALFGIAIILMAVQLAMLRHDVWLPGCRGGAAYRVTSTDGARRRSCTTSRASNVCPNRGCCS